MAPPLGPAPARQSCIRYQFMSQIIVNGGNPLKDCPTSWDNARLWESAANAGRHASESPTWKWDCGFKLDYDGPVLSFSSRFYPPKTHYGSTWDGSVTVLLLGQEIDEKDFDCETLHELRTQVEAYRDQWVARLRCLLVPQKEEP